MAFPDIYTCNIWQYSASVVRTGTYSVCSHQWQKSSSPSSDALFVRLHRAVFFRCNLTNGIDVPQTGDGNVSIHHWTTTTVTAARQSWVHVDHDIRSSSLRARPTRRNTIVPHWPWSRADSVATYSRASVVTATAMLVGRAGHAGRCPVRPAPPPPYYWRRRTLGQSAWRRQPQRYTALQCSAALLRRSMHCSYNTYVTLQCPNDQLTEQSPGSARSGHQLHSNNCLNLEKHFRSSTRHRTYPANCVCDIACWLRWNRWHASPSSQQLWSVGFSCGRPCDVELVIRQSERSGHQQRPGVKLLSKGCGSHTYRMNYGWNIFTVPR